MSDKIVPFGKYKGERLTTVLKDKEYAEWLVEQPWVREEFKGIYNEILKSLRAPQQTPVHNKLQGYFLDCMFVNKFIDNLLGATDFKFQYFTKFEELDWDVFVEMQWPLPFESTPYHEQKRVTIHVECKPTVADDYPAVLRQIKKRGTRHSPYIIARALLVGAYTGVGVSEADFRRIFWLDRIKVVFLHEILSSMPTRSIPPQP